MSDVYAGGVKATAIAAITAAIEARIVDLPDGTKDLDRESLNAWLRAEFDSMLADAEASSAAYVAGIDTGALVAGLNAKIRKEAFMSRSDWPNANVILSTSSIAAAVREQQGALKTLSTDVTTFYSTTASKMFAVIAAYLAENVESSIPDGVTRQVLSSAVIVTWVTDRGEESAPSPASILFNRDQNDSFTITVEAPPSGRNITHFRPYMAASTSSSAAYFLIPNPDDVDGWPIGDLSITPMSEADPTVGIKDAELQEPCPTTTWEEPPADLRCIVSMGNGIDVGFTGNTIVPCEPYKQYAFPPEYRKTTSHPIVGLCAMDQVLVVGTQGPPKILAGADSASLTEIKNNSGQACVSARSMVAINDVVIYASPDGLCAASASGQVMLITGPEGHNLWAREDWQALSPASIFAAELEGSYVFHVPAGFCYCLDPRSGKLTTLSVTGSAFYRDQLTDTLYLAGGTAITALFSDSTYRAGVWKSKRIVLPKDTGFAFLQVNSEFEDDVTVRIYRNGTLHRTKVVTSRAPLKCIPPGRGVEWEVEIESTARVTGVTLASTSDELRAI